MNVINVTAAIIINKGTILIARRAPSEKHAGGWEFPGGKVEPGESPEECLRREIFEEFGIETSIKRFIVESTYMYKSGAIRLMAYLTEIVSGEIKLSVHDSVEWVDVDELLNYKLLPADIPIAMKLKEGSI